MTPLEALNFANYYPGHDIEKYQKIACKYSASAYDFANEVPGANIEYCQKKACASFWDAYHFARYIPEANIEFCYKNIRYNKNSSRIYRYREGNSSRIIEYCYKNGVAPEDRAERELVKFILEEL